MTHEDSFKDELKPINFGKGKIKGSYFQNVQYSVQLVTPFDTPEQQQEVINLLIKTYTEQSDDEVDQIVPVKLDVDFEAFALNVLYNQQIKNRIFLFPLKPWRQALKT